MKLTTPAPLATAVLTAVLLGGCSDKVTAPEPEGVPGGGGAAAAPAGAAFGSKGLVRHIESYAGSVPGLSNFSLTLKCPKKMFAVSGGHDVGADSEAAQFLVSKPFNQPNEWTFVVFNPHATPRPFEVYVVCLK